MQAVTQRGVPPPVALQNAWPPGQAQVQVPALRVWPPWQEGTHLPPHRVDPAVHWQVQVAELRTWPLPAGQVATQLSWPLAVHGVWPPGQPHLPVVMQ